MRMRFRACLMLLAIVALTGCRYAEHSRRVASDAFASFVLESLLRVQTPLTQGTVQRSSPRPAPPTPLAAPATMCKLRIPKATTKTEVLPLAPRRISADALVASAVRLERCSKVRAARESQRLAAADLASMQIEIRFAVAQSAQFSRHRLLVVKTEAL